MKARIEAAYPIASTYPTVWCSHAWARVFTTSPDGNKWYKRCVRCGCMRADR